MDSERKDIMESLVNGKHRPIERNIHWGLLTTLMERKIDGKDCVVNKRLE